MNAARLGIGAQSTGLCEAAYREALKYAHERQQFGKPIVQFPAIYEILCNMQAKLFGTRALLYETTRFVEIYKQYTHISHERDLTAEERAEMKFYTKLADGFTPLTKLFSSEYANKLTFDAIQILGGSGYMKDYPCERLYRDARITNIYEGTSQLQVVAAINHIVKGTYLEQIKVYEAQDYGEKFAEEHKSLIALREKFEQAIGKVESVEAEHKNAGFRDFHARRLVECAGHIIITYLLMGQAVECEDYVKPAKVFAKTAQAEVAAATTYIAESDWSDIEMFSSIIGTQAE